MKAVEFPQVNVHIGKDQPEYNTLPAFRDPEDKTTRVIACFELDDDEIGKLKETKKIWFSQTTFGYCMQPVLLTVNRDDVMIVIEDETDNPAKTGEAS